MVSLERESRTVIAAANLAAVWTVYVAAGAEQPIVGKVV